jgi:hypothetical protein
MTVVGILLFALTLYFSLDTARDWTDVFHMSAKNIPDLEATALFVLTLIWPALSVFHIRRTRSLIVAPVERLYCIY